MSSRKGSDFAKVGQFVGWENFVNTMDKTFHCPC